MAVMSAMLRGGRVKACASGALPALDCDNAGAAAPTPRLRTAVTSTNRNAACPKPRLSLCMARSPLPRCGAEYSPVWEAPQDGRAGGEVASGRLVSGRFHRLSGVDDGRDFTYFDRGL